MERGEVLHRIGGHRGAVHALALLPGADPLVVSGGDDKALRLWYPISGRSAGSYQMPDAVRALASTPDGRLLAAFGWDGMWLLPPRGPRSL